jgi:L-ascorbate metabolism protein UlaG (beta-lactamase superfamily)
MELTKYGHSCIRVATTVEGQDVTLTIDPGNLSNSSEALEGTDAVLVTHGHADHLDEDLVAAFLTDHPDVPLCGPADVIATLSARDDAAAFEDRLVTLHPNDEVDVMGVPVRTVGGQHALIHPLIRTIDNLGYILEGSVFHPGDSLVVPAGPADLAVHLVPAWAPWSKTQEVVDFIAAVRARRAYGIHDAPLAEAGQGIVGKQLTNLGGRTGTAYEPWPEGTTVTV